MLRHHQRMRGWQHHGAHRNTQQARNEFVFIAHFHFLRNSFSVFYALKILYILIPIVVIAAENALLNKRFTGFRTAHKLHQYQNAQTAGTES